VPSHEPANHRTQHGNPVASKLILTLMPGTNDSGLQKILSSDTTTRKTTTTKKVGDISERFDMPEIRCYVYRGG
jgi:hypothetical protein